MIVAIPTNLSDHTPILTSFKYTIKPAENLPFGYINTWCAIEGYVNCVMERLKATTWGDYTHQLITKLRHIKDNLK